MNAGIDYGMGTTNRDPKTGIRYGVIPIRELYEEIYGDSEAIYPDTFTWDCERCHYGFDVPYSKQYNQWVVCPSCKARNVIPNYVFEESEPIGYDYTPNSTEYTTESDETDVFVTKSPYYTFANFCSPCAPGACYLLSPNPDGVKAYCFGHDFFDGEKAPYPVYRVDDDSEVMPEGNESV